MRPGIDCPIARNAAGDSWFHGDQGIGRSWVPSLLPYRATRHAGDSRELQYDTSRAGEPLAASRDDPGESHMAILYLSCDREEIL